MFFSQVFVDPHLLGATLKGLSKAEDLWNDEFLTTLCMMLLGVLFIMVTTYRTSRTSRSFTFKFAIFIIWEFVLLVYFFIH
jgi:hypothetical protein